MDKYEKLAEAFEMEELEERIEFNGCELHALLHKMKSLCDSISSQFSGKDSCGSGGSLPG